MDHELLRQALSALRAGRCRLCRCVLDSGKTGENAEGVAELMGISQSYISRLEKRIMLRLRREISVSCAGNLGNISGCLLAKSCAIIITILLSITFIDINQLNGMHNRSDTGIWKKFRKRR